MDAYRIREFLAGSNPRLESTFTELLSEFDDTLTVSVAGVACLPKNGQCDELESGSKPEAENAEETLFP